MTSKKRITQYDRLAVFVSKNPGCTAPNVCDAFNAEAGSAGAQLITLMERGILTRKYNGTHYEYTVAPGADIPDIELPQPEQKADPALLAAALEEARGLEQVGLWRRAATRYTEIMRICCNGAEIWDIAKLRTRCLRKARTRRAAAC
ncbi:PerC family transcriptional regulator [Phytobacter sp. V91]|uniref:PerC family transcriptional regulator n=1 Tax=Phytobacter sp. V91 TaxID=3369425 RepID=UPI003F622261